MKEIGSVHLIMVLIGISRGTLTCDGCCYGVGDDGPELSLVGVGGYVHLVDDRR